MALLTVKKVAIRKARPARGMNNTHALPSNAITQATNTISAQTGAASIIFVSEAQASDRDDAFQACLPYCHATRSDCGAFSACCWPMVESIVSSNCVDSRYTGSRFGDGWYRRCPPAKCWCRSLERIRWTSWNLGRILEADRQRGRPRPRRITSRVDHRFASRTVNSATVFPSCAVV